VAGPFPQGSHRSLLHRATRMERRAAKALLMWMTAPAWHLPPMSSRCQMMSLLMRGMMWTSQSSSLERCAYAYNMWCMVQQMN